jgi:hypothetical protein
VLVTVQQNYEGPLVAGLAPEEKEKVLVTARQNYEDPLVAGLASEEKETLCYDLDDLKKISNRIPKQ